MASKLIEEAVTEIVAVANERGMGRVEALLFDIAISLRQILKTNEEMAQEWERMTKNW